MSNPKAPAVPEDESTTPVHGLVVDHKEAKVRYAVSPSNFNSKVHTLVRPLKQSETVRGFVPKTLPVKSEDKPADKATEPATPAAQITTRN